MSVYSMLVGALYSTCDGLRGLGGGCAAAMGLVRAALLENTLSSRLGHPLELAFFSAFSCTRIPPPRQNLFIEFDYEASIPHPMLHLVPSRLLSLTQAHIIPPHALLFAFIQCTFHTSGRIRTSCCAALYLVSDGMRYRPASRQPAGGGF